MGNGMPKDTDGLDPCDWCGGPIRQPATGRRRRYCSRTHRELAYRERKTVRRVDEAVGQAVAAVASARPDSSVDETRTAPDTSVDETWPNSETSVDETRSPGAFGLSFTAMSALSRRASNPDGGPPAGA